MFPPYAKEGGFGVIASALDRGSLGSFLPFWTKTINTLPTLKLRNKLIRTSLDTHFHDLLIFL